VQWPEMRSLASRVIGMTARLNRWFDAMATTMFHNAGSPRQRDDAARDEFTAEFTAGLDTAARRQSAGRNRQQN
jgi:hypothetical protein